MAAVVRALGPAVILLVAWLTGNGCWGRQSPEFRAALAARELAARKLAEQIAAETPPEKVVVLGNPFTRQAGRPFEIYAFERASFRGIERAFGGGELAVYYPEIRSAAADGSPAVAVPPDTTTPLSFLVVRDAMDRLRAQYPNAEVVISLIGIPPGIVQERASRERNGLRFGFLLPDWRVLGDARDVRVAFTSKTIVAAVLRRPGASEETSWTGDPERDFDERFILVTPANIDAVLNDYPELF